MTDQKHPREKTLPLADGQPVTPPNRQPEREIEPPKKNPEIYPQKSPEIFPQKTEHGVGPGIESPEIFPQKSPEVFPDARPAEIPPNRD